MAYNDKSKYESMPDEDKVSRINAAGIINITIENLWKDCYSSMAKGDFIIWNRKLDSIWAILGGDEKEGSDVEKKFNKIDLAIYETGSLSNSKNGFEKPSGEHNHKRAVQYLLLRKKTIFLRRLQNKQGKGTAYTSEDDFDI